MSRHSLWTPRVLFSWLLLWPLVMAAQPPELALDPVRLTSEPPGPNEPWSFHPSDLPAESPPALTNLADPGSFNLAGSSAAAAQMVASPQALPETVIPFLDAAGDLPPEPDPFAVPLQDPQDQQEALAQLSERPEGDDTAPLPLEALAQPLEPPEGVQPTSTEQEAPAQPAEPHEEVEASSVQLEAPTQAPEFPTIPVSNDIVPGYAGLFQADESDLPSVTLKSMDVELSITPESTKDFESSTLLQKAPPQPPESSMGVLEQHSVYPEVTFFHVGPGEAQPPVSPTIPAKAVDLGLFITPQPTDEVKTPSRQEAPPQPPEKTKSSPVLPEAPQQSPEPPTEVVVQSPTHSEGTLSASGWDPAQHSNVTVTVRPLDMGLTKTSQPTMELEHSTALTKTSAPPRDHEVTRPHPEQVQSQHPNLIEVTIQPLDLELTVTAGSNEEAKISPTVQNTPTQPPKPPKEAAVQPPLYREVTLTTSAQDEPQNPMSHSITVHPVDLGLTVAAEPTTEAKPSTALTKTTAPSPRHPEVTLPHPEQVQVQHPYLTEVTVQPVDLEVTVTQQPESPEMLPPTTEQGASRNLDICELCTCKDGTLSCTGLSPEQRLRRVPVLESHIYSGTFTIVNLQGNSISYIDENIWQSYRWVETQNCPAIE